MPPPLATQSGGHALHRLPCAQHAAYEIGVEHPTESRQIHLHQTLLSLRDACVVDQAFQGAQSIDFRKQPQDVAFLRDIRLKGMRFTAACCDFRAQGLRRIARLVIAEHHCLSRTGGKLYGRGADAATAASHQQNFAHESLPLGLPNRHCCSKCYLSREKRSSLRQSRLVMH